MDKFDTTRGPTVDPDKANKPKGSGNGVDPDINADDISPLLCDCDANDANVNETRMPSICFAELTKAKVAGNDAREANIIEVIALQHLSL